MTDGAPINPTLINPALINPMCIDADVRIGTDIVAIAEIRESIAAHGDRYLQRVYTDAERADCGTDVVRLAARFAAKEALVKALRIPDLATPPREVSTELHDGLPILRVSGSLGKQLHTARLRVAGVSLSHADCHAIATVLLVASTAR